MEGTTNQDRLVNQIGRHPRTPVPFLNRSESSFPTILEDFPVVYGPLPAFPCRNLGLPRMVQLLRFSRTTRGFLVSRGLGSDP